MPNTCTGMNITGLLRTINDSKVVELLEDNAMGRLPKLYAYYKKLEAAIRKTELNIGHMLMSINCDDAESGELKEIWSQMQTRDEDKLKLWEDKVLMKEIIAENECQKGQGKIKKERTGRGDMQKREEEKEKEKRCREMEERDARKN